jgi:ankyrin repeat protein
MNCLKYNSVEFKLNRRKFAFPAFINHTNSKIESADVITKFLGKIIGNITKNDDACIVNDLGLGEGSLAYLLISKLKDICAGKQISYFGIEKIEDFVNTAQLSLPNLLYANTSIIKGDCFLEENILKLSPDPTIMLASHILYYLKHLSVEEFIEKIVSKTNKITIIITQAGGSIISDLSNSYSENQNIKQLQNKLHLTLKNHSDLAYSEIIFKSKITIDKLLSLAELNEIANKDFSKLTKSEQDVRHILEMLASSTLEYIKCRDDKQKSDKLKYLIEDIYTHLSYNNNSVQFWNYMIVAIPNNLITQTNLTKSAEKFYRSYYNITHTYFDLAQQDMNYEIMHSILSDYASVCNLKELVWVEKHSIINDIYSWLKFYLRFELFWPDLLSKLHLNLNLGTLYNCYQSNEILEIKSKLEIYNFYSKYGFNYNIMMQDHFASAPGKHARTYPVLIEEIIPAIAILSIFFLVSDLYAISCMGISMYFMLINFSYKHYDSVNAVIHHFDGDSFIFKTYLLQPEHLKTLTLKNFDKRNSLHLAIITKDKIKIKEILACSEKFNQQIFVQKDYYGYLPIHYAAMHNDTDLFKLLYQKTNLKNQAMIASPYGFELALEICFFCAKFFFFHGMFVSWINQDSLKNLFKFSSIASFNLGYKAIFQGRHFPDTLYYHIFQTRLNDFTETIDNDNYAYRTYDYNTPLHLATIYNNTKIIEFLLETLANPNCANKFNESPIYLAKTRGNLEAFKKAKPNPEPCSEYSYKWDLALDFVIKTTLVTSNNNLKLQSAGNILLLFSQKREFKWTSSYNSDLIFVITQITIPFLNLNFIEKLIGYSFIYGMELLVDYGLKGQVSGLFNEVSEP